MEIERNTQLFLSLINSFQMQTMMQLGKLKNPFTEESEKDLAAAQISIDILDMLKEKTMNNLSEEETRFLSQVIADLKINYVEEKNRETSKPEVEAKTEENKTEEISKDSESTETESKADTEKEEKPEHE